MELCLAIDIGGTKLAAGLITAEGDVLESSRVPTPRTGDSEELFAALVGLVRSVLEADTAVTGKHPVVCGVGCGGPMDRGAGTVSPLNIPAWRDFPLRARVEQLTGLPVAVDNDAKAFALGEGWTGAARGRRDFLALVVSTAERVPRATALTPGAVRTRASQPTGRPWDAESAALRAAGCSGGTKYHGLTPDA